MVAAAVGWTENSHRFEQSSNLRNKPQKNNALDWRVSESRSSEAQPGAKSKSSAKRSVEKRRTQSTETGLKTACWELTTSISVRHLVRCQRFPVTEHARAPAFSPFRDTSIGNRAHVPFCARFRERRDCGIIAVHIGRHRTGWCNMVFIGSET